MRARSCTDAAARLIPVQVLGWEIAAQPWVRASNSFIAWIVGKNPDLNIIYGSYGDELGVRANKALQRTTPARD